MNAKFLAIASAIMSLAITTSMAGTAQAQADMIAGWDFSQYYNAGLLSTDGASFTDTLPANYSDLDGTNNAGAESAAFGTMYIDGTNGSTAVNISTLAAQIVPTSNSLSTNSKPACLQGANPFESLTVLKSEGQAYTNKLSMIGRVAMNAVFEADLSSVPQAGKNWSVSFAGRSFQGTSSVDVLFSTDGTGYTSYGTVALTTADTPQTVVLDTATSQTGYVLFSFTPGGGANQPLIDNVAICAELVADSDGDGVFDVNDNCVNVANPPATYPANRTTTGGQLDDDADGYGNLCDGKFTPGPIVTALDTIQYKAAINKPLTASTCGSPPTKPCDQFDLDGLSPVVTALDTIRFKQLLNKPVGPKCALCPLACVGDACP